MASIKINGTGCSLGDFVYNGINFSDNNFRKYLSKTPGDGGLSPGALVFTEEFEKYSNIPYKVALSDITSNREPNKFNLGGPGIVAIINASQLLHQIDANVNFYAAIGKDKIGDQILSIVNKTPVNSSNYYRFDSASPFTDVLSDPNYDQGKGERIFINNIGCAWDLTSEYLTDDFFNADILVFGGTALVPKIHDDLTNLLLRAKKNGCITVVNTVYDFRNQKLNPSKPWPIGMGDSLQYIDLLIMDYEEALKISGEIDIHNAILYFRNSNVGAFIITHGAYHVKLYSSGKLFKKIDAFELPVSEKVVIDLKQNPTLKGDTTGCGDNFAGGVIASLALQKYAGEKQIDLREAISWGIASGGFACFYMGGTYLEQNKGEKYQSVYSFYSEYQKQLSKGLF